MPNFLLCIEKVLQYIFYRHRRQNRLPSKKFSNVQTCITQYDSPSEEIDNSESKFIKQINSNIFCPPDFDFQSVAKSKFNNLTINQCQNSSIAVLQILENTYIDNSSNCILFVGPCVSTLFIRNCHNIKIRAIAQQLRIQDSVDITIEGIIGVQPVLQNCKQIRMCSLQCMMYQDLIWQMQLAEINPFDNRIFQCYDFTPQKVPNYSFKFPQVDYQWQRQLIKQNLLGQQTHELFLPKINPMKLSITKRNYIDKDCPNMILFGLIAIMSLKELLVVFSSQKIHKVFTVMASIPEEDGRYYFKKYLPQTIKQGRQRQFYICLKCSSQIRQLQQYFDSPKMTIITDSSLIKNYFNS